MQMHHRPGRKRRNGLIGRSATASGLILRAIRGGDGSDRIRLIPRDSVDPFDLKALPARDLDGWPWQRALIRPHLSWGQDACVSVSCTADLLSCGDARWEAPADNP